MAQPKGGRQQRSRGSIDTLPSGALRVRVYAGIDPVSKRNHYLTEVVQPGPKAHEVAEQTRTRLLNQVDERRNPRTRATVNQLLERHLAMLDVAPATLSGYRGYVKRHIRPLLGHVKVGALDGETLDSFYAELRRCQQHCKGRPRLEHRTSGRHECDEHGGEPCSPPDPGCRACRRRCRPHVCDPLNAGTIRHIHFLLHGAFKRAVRWRWVTDNPIGHAEPPALPKPSPRPPTAEEAARIVTAAWDDPDWATFIWLAMTTGARRGELCALQWVDLDLDNAVVVLRQGVAKDEHGRWSLKGTKTHQQRRVALDPDTTQLLTEHRARAKSRAAALGVDLDDRAFVFSLAPDHSAFLLPESVSQRYARLAQRLGIHTKLHALRHYNATELILAGVDVRTVAGRLGHSGGGITTLRVYSAWREEADQRAAQTLSARMPARPNVRLDSTERAKSEPRSPYEKIAAMLRLDILDGSLPTGSTLPSAEEIAASNNVAAATAHRAIELLKTWGLVEASRGPRAVVTHIGAFEPGRMG